MPEVRELALRAREASRVLAGTSSATRDQALLAMAAAMLERADLILASNLLDMQAAREAGTPGPLLDRLMLDEGRIAGIAAAIVALAREADPIGEVVSGHRMPNGIWLTQVRVPLGVVAMIYEARPNVTADAAALTVKTANAVILRGGSIALRSCMAITEVLADAIQTVGLPRDAIQYISSTDRAATDELMSLHGLIDVLIPRGGAGLINTVVANSKVPVIETGVGNCHVYVHAGADVSMAVPIVTNSKCQRPGVCNAAESLLVDEAIAAEALPPIVRALADAGVELVGDARAVALGGGFVAAATEDDWGTEYLDLKMSIKVVPGLDEAIAHINRYGTRHSEAIVTGDYEAAKRFVDEVDAAAVYVNASTRFTDGGEFGLGAEIGISTQKLHARGPMGLVALTSTKFIGMGSGQVRA
ncbi:MAG TPA: glutamate-5-semialdehyde dehydrogenase [Coriobacteriia bacterium]